jgi:hypothetical protein
MKPKKITHAWGRLLRVVSGTIPKKQHGIAHLETYEVSEHELNAIQRGFSVRTNDLTFLSIFLSVFLSFLSVWLTLPTPPPEAPLVPLTRVQQFYVCMMIASGGLSVYLLVRWWMSARADDDLFRVIRERAIGPVGEEDKIIKPSDLASMTPQEAPREGGAQ